MQAIGKENQCETKPVSCFFRVVISLLFTSTHIANCDMVQENR